MMSPNVECLLVAHFDVRDAATSWTDAARTSRFGGDWHNAVSRGIWLVQSSAEWMFCLNQWASRTLIGAAASDLVAAVHMHLDPASLP